jgi:hypothetical protein
MAHRKGTPKPNQACKALWQRASDGVAVDGYGSEGQRVIESSEGPGIQCDDGTTRHHMHGTQ